MSNSFDLDQARHFVGPDLGPNCLQKLSADDTSSTHIKKIKTELHARLVFERFSFHKSLVVLSLECW